MLLTFLVSILISYINGKCANMKQKFDKILGKLVLSVRESPMVDGQLPLGQTPPLDKGPLGHLPPYDKSQIAL